MSYKSINQNRDSGIELLRIFLMLGIVAGHLLVHGGGIENFLSNGNRWFVSCVSPLGLIGYDGFLAISFYYLCDSQYKTKRLLKVFLQVAFYSILMAFISYLFKTQVFYTGTTTTTVTNLSFRQIMAAFFPITGSSHPFASIYMLFYLTLPFIRKVSDNISKKQNLVLILLLFYFEYLIRAIQSFTGYSGTVTATSYGTFVYIYFIVLYLKRYKSDLMQNKGLWIKVFFTTYLLQSILRYLHYYHSENLIIKILSTTYLWGGSWAPLNIISGIAVLCIGLSLKYESKIINSIAQGTFAVLLIHDNNYFRYVLYSKLVRAEEILPNMTTLNLAITTVLFSLCIFSISIVIDTVRKIVLERNLMECEFVNIICKKFDDYLEEKKGTST